MCLEQFWQDRQSIFDIRQRFTLFGDRLPKHWFDGWLLFVINQDYTYILTNPDYLLSLNEMSRLRFGLEKMLEGQPLAYLIGSQGFWKHEFLVNQHTLIPRADTECLVREALRLAQEPKGQILDLGTGSGCIGISLAKELPDWQVVLVDTHQETLNIAKQNIDKLQATNASCLLSHWYDKVTGRFDLIVSNPPYIDPQDQHLSQLMAEPITALVADKSGLADLEAIIFGAKNHLKPGGYLLLEHGYDQADSVANMMQAANFCQLSTIQDYGGNDRVTLGKWQS